MKANTYDVSTGEIRQFIHSRLPEDERFAHVIVCEPFRYNDQILSLKTRPCTKLRLILVPNKRLSKLINIDSVVMEDVRIDTQLMDDPAIEGKAYQQGTLSGYELRQYLLDRYQHRCQYCGGISGDPVLEWEHKIPKSRGGSDSIKNATLACHTCNQEKGSLTPGEWAKKIQDKAKLTDLDRARLSLIVVVS